ncbi:MAG: hypothetical protein Q8R83_02835 [Legionellaceae bacterium]|nr:hypothetical protein [Legionellaceae bacterium]
MLFGCVTTNHGYGVIIAERKENDTRDRKNHMQDRIKHDAKIVGMTSAIGGGVLGGSFALWYGIMEGVSIGSVLAGTAIWATAGAFTFGMVGVVAGGTAGYFIEKAGVKSNLYQFTVKSLQDVGKVYIVKQYSSPIPLNTRVKILERDGFLFIRKSWI